MGECRAGDARTGVALVAARVLEQVLLVVVLRVPETRGGVGVRSGGDDRLNWAEPALSEHLLVGRSQGGRVAQLIGCSRPDLRT